MTFNKGALALTLSLFFTFSLSAQNSSKRVLFLGNSYTFYNNLPQLLADVATSMGDTVVFDSNTPGGSSFETHSTNNTSINKIMAGYWDYVVLQEQSQRTSLPISFVEQNVFPYASQLDAMINLYNPCAETIFYMTWGRKNGDASNCGVWPPVCTYQGMDSLIYERYLTLADTNDAVLSPVGAVWKYIRTNYPGIELYDADESHPSPAGSFAAACSFYTVIFQKNPLDIPFNFSLSANDAANIKTAVKAIVYDQLAQWHVGEYITTANFSYVPSGMNVSFQNESQFASSFIWNFGDGNSSTETNPLHTYSSTGSYTVTLIANRCGQADTSTQIVLVDGLSSIEETDASKMDVFPNPSSGMVYFSMPCNIQLHDLTGKLVEQRTLVNSINITEVKSGIYFISFIDNDGRVFQKEKIIKQ